MSHVVGWPSAAADSVTVTRSETACNLSVPRTVSRSDCKDESKSTVEESMKRYSPAKMDALVDSVLSEVAIYYESAATATASVDELSQEDPAEREVDVEETEHIVKYSRSPAPDYYSSLASKVVFQHGNYEALLKNLRMEQELGSGASCRVYAVSDAASGASYAVKELAAGNPQSLLLFTQEIELLRKLDHPNIVAFHDCFADAARFYIGTELCSGGTLFALVLREGTLLDARAARYAKDIVSAVAHMHSKQIVHRDMKASNVVLSHRGDDAVVKIIDFGDSELVRDDAVYTDFVGTVHYMPPEIVRARTGRDLKKSDMWSIGIIAYLMVCGRRPFGGKTELELFKNIVSKPRKLPYPKSLFVSQRCRNFIGRLICHDIEHRMGAAEALGHEWVAGQHRRARARAHVKSGGKPSVRVSNALKSPLLAAASTPIWPALPAEDEPLPKEKEPADEMKQYLYLSEVEETEVLRETTSPTSLSAHNASGPLLPDDAEAEGSSMMESSLCFDHDFEL